VLVTEHRHRRAGFAKDFRDPLDDAMSRIELLTAAVKRVAAMLADEQNRVDREIISAEGHCFADRRENREAILPAERAAHVFDRDLVSEHRDDLRARLDALPVRGIAVEQSPDDDVGVGLFAVFGDDGGDALLRRLQGGDECAAGG